MSPYDYNFIFIHWTANDDHIKKFYGGDIKKVKIVFETLVRTALALLKASAVIIFEGFGSELPVSIANDLHHDIASHYDIPIILTREAFWHSVALQADIQRLIKMRSIHPPSDFHDRYACLVFGNWIKEFYDTAPKPATV